MTLTLKAARINRGFTQKNAAKELNVSKDTLGNWERGKTFPPIDKLSEICELYKVNINDLIFLPANNALSVNNGISKQSN